MSSYKKEKADVRRLVGPNKSPDELLTELKNALNGDDYDNRELIKSIVKLIEEEFTFEKYMEKIGNDSKKMSNSAYKLLKGEAGKDFTVANLNQYYQQYLRGKYDAYDFMLGVDKLFTELNREFDELEEWFLTGKIENKEANYYERS